VSSRGETGLTGMLEVELRYALNGEMADIMTLTPAITNDE
jgi:hypothetical protein